MSEEDIFDSLPGIGNVIASDIVPAMAYLHSRDIVHSDKKHFSVQFPL